MRRFVSALLVSALLVPLMAQASFSDLEVSHSHYTAIMDLVDQGILEGYGDGTFRPDQDVTRAETVKIVLLGAGFDVETASELHFTDVSESDWHVNYVESAYRSGIVQGYGDGSFLPNQTVTRAEAIKIVLSSVETEYASVTSNVAGDVLSEDWFAPYAAYAVEWNIIPLQTDGLWHPHEEASRGELAEMMYRLQQVLETGEEYDETSLWTEVEFPTVDVALTVPTGWYTKQEGVGAVWLLDSAHHQYSLLTPYEDGATLLMTRYSNPEGKSSATIFANIDAYTNSTTVQTTINGFPTLLIHRDEDLYFREWYIYLDNGRVVHFIALRGQGDRSSELEYYLNEIVESVTYLPSGDTGMTTEEIVEALRAAIQVDGVGIEKISLLSDVSIIETDTIGIGTGPVDYYYSPSANITIKYERSFDVILDIEDGQTTAF